MTVEKANNMIDDISWTYGGKSITKQDIVECRETCHEALEKQIPKKPIKQIWVDDEKHKGDVRLATKDDVLTKDNHGTINLCPNCEERVMRYKYLRPPNDKDYYCKHCGQRLDWSDAE